MVQERCPEDTWQNGGPIWFYSIYYNSLLPETEKRIYPFQSLSTNTITIQLTLNSSRGGASEAFSKSKINAFEKFVYPYSRNKNSIHEKSRPIWERDLAVLIFVEHIRKLTIKFICLFQFRFGNTVTIWAATWQNQQCGSAPSDDSEPGHPPSLIRVFAVRTKKHWVLSYPLSAQRRLCSDRADAQADQSLRWVHTHFVGFVMSWLISPLKRRDTLAFVAFRLTNMVTLWAASRKNQHNDCASSEDSDQPGHPPR